MLLSPLIFTLPQPQEKKREYNIDKSTKDDRLHFLAKYSSVVNYLIYKSITHAAVSADVRVLQNTIQVGICLYQISVFFFLSILIQ